MVIMHMVLTLVAVTLLRVLSMHTVTSTGASGIVHTIASVVAGSMLLSIVMETDTPSQESGLPVDEARS